MSKDFTPIVDDSTMDNELYYSMTQDDRIADKEESDRLQEQEEEHKRDYLLELFEEY